MPTKFNISDVLDNSNEEKNHEKDLLTPICDFLNEPEEKHPWLVDGILGNGSTSLLCSKPKVGKTTLLYSLASSVCRGDEWLGRKTIKSPCITIFLEDKKDEVRNRYQAIGSNEKDDLFIYCGRAPKTPIKWLQKIISDYKPGLLIVDTWLRLFSSVVYDINCYGETTRIFDDIIELARQSGTHLLFTHHLGKKGSGTNAILGSTGLFSSVDTTILLQKIKGKRTIQSIQRYGDDMAEQKFILDSKSMRVELEDIQKQISDDLLQKLQDEKPLKEVEIMNLVSGDTGAKRTALRNLVENNLIKRLGAGTKGNPYLYTSTFSSRKTPPYYADKKTLL